MNYRELLVMILKKIEIDISNALTIVFLIIILSIILGMELGILKQYTLIIITILNQ